MKRFISMSLLLVALFYTHQSFAQCNPGQSQIKIVLKTDQYPAETNWKVYDGNNNVLLQSPTGMIAGTVYMDSICVPAGACYQFKITDQANDGICCNYGFGHYELYLDNALVKRDSAYGGQSTAWMGCPAGANCSTALTPVMGTQTTAGPNTWYKFDPTTTGVYKISTCSLGNTCNTKIWVYDYCSGLQFSNGNAATIYYADNNCGTDAFVNAYLQTNHSYYIRIGDENSSCTGTPINWELTHLTTIVGCMDTASCTFNPFATVNDPNACLYYPDVNCPTGADLVVDSNELSVSMIIDSQQSNSQCIISEGCMNGYGMRTLIRFDTKISNIGATDFYAGPPPSSPNAYSAIFEWDQCHGHWHFEDYAEYLLADANNNFIPIGYKNGFCVLDLTCSTGIGKYGCNNMGITSGCADIYGAYLDCQWIDITDVPDGQYKLLVRVNWQPRPDFYGRYEVSYTNNWARACIDIHHDAQNNRAVTVLPNCAPYVDCNGVVNGLSEKDCDGNCNGGKLTGDLNQDSLRNNTDVSFYLTGSIHHTLPATKCNDLNDDGKINVIDAALMYECAKHGGGTIPLGHSHEPCRFPNKIKNPNQTANFSIGNIDYIAKTMDVYITNVDAKVLGYQLKLKGVTLSLVQNTLSGFNAAVSFNPSGEIIVLSNNEVPIAKHVTATMALRFKYNTIDSNKVCIDSVVAVVNEAYEQINGNAIDSICITAVPTPSDVAGLQQGKKHNLYPNPFTHTTMLAIDQLQGATYDVRLYDMYGRTVREYKHQTAPMVEIQRGTLAPGLYLLDVQSERWQFKEKLVAE